MLFSGKTNLLGGKRGQAWFIDVRLEGWSNFSPKENYAETGAYRVCRGDVSCDGAGDRREAIVKYRLFAKGSQKVSASNRVAGKSKKDRDNVKKPCLIPYPRDHESARPRFVADAQCATLVAPDAPQELLQGMEVVGDRPRLAHLPGAPRFGHCGGDRLTRSLRSSRPCGAACGSLPHLPAANRGSLWTSSPM